MQEPMNSIMHRWSHSWYRSRYCPSSIVQDGGDTAINGTVPIYFRACPDLCHHVGRGINPRGRAVTGGMCAWAAWVGGVGWAACVGCMGGWRAWVACVG